MQELGALSPDGKWEERYLCLSPQERLFLHGRWQDGIEPSVGLRGSDQEQFKRIDDLIQQHRAGGKFTIPLELGLDKSRGDRDIAALDRMTFAAWLKQQGFDSRYLLWYADYATRDDYGAGIDAVSAWSGIHYFAAREHEEKGPLTWPEGNGWIARRLIAKLERFIRKSAMVHRVERSSRGNKFRVLAGGTAFLTGNVIFAAPTFLAPYVIEGFAAKETAKFVYSPWVTANLVIERPPRSRGPQLETAWDNVIYDSPSLGYVVANHQSLAQHQERSVWTYYWALAADEPRLARQKLLAATWEEWKKRILSDLERVHPDIRECVSRIDIMRLGHAMVRPAPGFMGAEERKRLAAGDRGLYFANSDLSGISIFEEAQFRGVEAARKVLKRLGRA